MERRPESLVELARFNGPTGWNACILLARAAPGSADDGVEDVLRRLVIERPEYDQQSGRVIAGWEEWLRELPGREDRATPAVRIPPSMQSAAAEAWVFLLGSTSDDPVEALAPVGLLLEERTLPAHLRAEFYVGLARWVPPARLPHVEHAFGEDGPTRAPIELRRAAIDACVVHAVRRPRSTNDRRDPGIWPDRVHDARSDSDPGIRAAYGLWSAHVGHERALVTLREQFDDVSATVREAAVNALGVLRTPDARDELEELAERAEPRLRGLAVGALARWDVSRAARFAADPSHVVRRALAEALGNSPSARSARLLVDLVVDRSTNVEAAAVDAVEEWSDELAAPILLRALEEGHWLTRTRADQALRRRLGRRYAYRKDAPILERRRAVQTISRTFDLPTEPPPTGPLAGETAESAERIRELTSYLADVASGEAEVRRLALDRLRSIPEDDVPLLESRLAAQPAGVREVVVGEVLPDVASIHAVLQRLSSSDVSKRRRAASELAEHARTRSLSPLVLSRLPEIVVEERDQLVWRHVLHAVQPDAGPEAARIVGIALHLPWPDLRVLACEYVGRHGREQHAPWLVPLLADRAVGVRRAAVRAAGLCGNPVLVHGAPTSEHDGPVGLRDLLTDEDEVVRRETAVALALLGDPAGLAELHRLSRHGAVDVRLAAIRAMQRTGNTAFVEPLVEIASTDGNSRVRRAALERLEALVPEAERPRTPPITRAPEVAAHLWESWWTTRGRRIVRVANETSAGAGHGGRQ